MRALAWESFSPRMTRIARMGEEELTVGRSVPTQTACAFCAFLRLIPADDHLPLAVPFSGLRMRFHFRYVAANAAAKRRSEPRMKVASTVGNPALLS